MLFKLFNVCLATIMTMLMIVLFIEYRFFCRQVQELLLLKQQYAQHVDVLQKKIDGDYLDESAMQNDVEALQELVEESSMIMDEIIAAENSDAPDNDDDYVDSVDDSFVVINRHPDYLRQSTIDYLEAQQLSALMTHIDTSPGIPEKNNKISQNKTARAETKIID